MNSAELNLFALDLLERAGLERRGACAANAVDENYSVIVEPGIVNIPGKGLRLDVYVGLDSIRHNRLVQRCTQDVAPLSTRTRIDSDALWFPCFTYGVHAGYFWSAGDVGQPLPTSESCSRQQVEEYLRLTVAEAVPAMTAFAGDRKLYGFVRNFTRPLAPWEMACAICACLAGRPQDAVDLYTMNANILSGPDRDQHALFWSRLSQEIATRSWEVRGN